MKCWSLFYKWNFLFRELEWTLSQILCLRTLTYELFLALISFSLFLRSLAQFFRPFIISLEYSFFLFLFFFFFFFFFFFDTVVLRIKITFLEAKISIAEHVASKIRSNSLVKLKVTLKLFYIFEKMILYFYINFMFIWIWGVRRNNYFQSIKIFFLGGFEAFLIIILLINYFLVIILLINYFLTIIPLINYFLIIILFICCYLHLVHSRTMFCSWSCFSYLISFLSPRFHAVRACTCCLFLSFFPLAREKDIPPVFIWINR